MRRSFLHWDSCLELACVSVTVSKASRLAEKAQHFGDHAPRAGQNVQRQGAGRKTGMSSLFLPGAVWTQDVTHAPLDRQSTAMIAWLADAGGWGTGKMRVDLNIRVLQADADTPFVPFHKGPGFYEADSDVVATFPLPVGGGIEGQPGYQCPIDEEDCHLIVADRSHNKLYETFQANKVGDAITANFLAVWDLGRIYPPSGRGDQCTSADAAGFPIAPLLFNADELATGSINHAIRFILPNPRMRAHVFVHPATHAGGRAGLLPLRRWAPTFV